MTVTVPTPEPSIALRCSAVAPATGFETMYQIETPEKTVMGTNQTILATMAFLSDMALILPVLLLGETCDGVSEDLQAVWGF
jgi:hypothetical protein